ncbi:DUF262 domain-containing protein [Neorhizobium tomejilense]|uniref:DUF262 domain-containing protein n=1 Tax=Neorhizobium tomejilense TaxID=2093828 RepID=UPI000CFA0E3D|nr:DUF262 domain-containing protein [Neorhizobium tomejilense]
MHIHPHTSIVSALLGTPNEQFLIPSYQRRYSWRKEQLHALLDDIDMIEGNDSHLLGTILCLSGAHTAGINTLELVDGQQRLTTICIILECLRERFEADGRTEQVEDLKRLLQTRVYGHPMKPKIALDTLDAEEFRRLAESAPEPDEHFHNGRLATAFSETRAWIGALTTEELAGFLQKLLLKAIVVRLDVSQAKDAFKLFETINNRGLKLSPSDIIKNFMLGNAARFGDEQLEVAKKSWALLISHLDGTDADSFFRYFLISKVQTRLTKAGVVAEFEWHFMNEVFEAEKLPERHFYYYDDEESDDDGETSVADAAEEHQAGEADAETVKKQTFVEFLKKLVRAAQVYGQLLKCDTGVAQIDRHLRNLRMIKSAQTYGFLMHLKAGGIDDKTFVKVLKLTESFVLRRHICRERANETETLFAELCKADPQDPLADIVEAYREASPSDEKFRDEFAATVFTSNIMDRARYCLEQYEMAMHGKHAEIAILGSEDVHVEHIIPQKIQSRRSQQEYGNWVEYLGERLAHRHPKFVNRIGNLTLFAGELNIVASNNPFSIKKANYKLSSILATKELTAMSQFKFPQVDARSKQLAEFAIERWPAP